MASKVKLKKISFQIPADDHGNFAVLAAVQPGAPSPGQYCRQITLEKAKEGALLKKKLQAAK